MLASSLYAAKRNEFCTSGPCEIGSNVPLQIHCRAKSATIVSQDRGGEMQYHVVDTVLSIT